MKTPKLTKRITVKFTRGDTKKATFYTSNENCLLATALKRMGYGCVSVGGWGRATIEGKEYRPSRKAGKNFYEWSWDNDKMKFRSRVIGKSITLYEDED